MTVVTSRAESVAGATKRSAARGGRVQFDPAEQRDHRDAQREAQDARGDDRDPDVHEALEVIVATAIPTRPAAISPLFIGNV